MSLAERFFIMFLSSFIVKIKAAEITPSGTLSPFFTACWFSFTFPDQYYLGYTMRFPRALMIREDLGIEDCMTASAVFESIRAEKRKAESSDGCVNFGYRNLNHETKVAIVMRRRRNGRPLRRRQRCCPSSTRKA